MMWRQIWHRMYLELIRHGVDEIKTSTVFHWLTVCWTLMGTCIWSHVFPLCPTLSLTGGIDWDRRFSIRWHTSRDKINTVKVLILTIWSAEIMNLIFYCILYDTDSYLKKKFSQLFSDNGFCGVEEDIYRIGKNNRISLHFFIFLKPTIYFWYWYLSCNKQLIQESYHMEIKGYHE